MSEPSIRTWREDGEYRRERVEKLDAEAWADARARVDGGLEWGVGALVERDGRVLLVRQDGRWLLPGGEVEAGESHEEALVRELVEETGIKVIPGPRLAVVRNVLRHEGAERAFSFAIHRATATTTETTADPGVGDEAIADVGWYADLPEDTLDRDLLVDLRGA